MAKVVYVMDNGERYTYEMTDTKLNTVLEGMRMGKGIIIYSDRTIAYAHVSTLEYPNNSVVVH
jgi:hypothetical protein